MNSPKAHLLRILCSYPWQLLIAAHLFSFPTFKRRSRFGLRAAVFALPAMVGFESCITMFPAGLLPGDPVLNKALLLIPTTWFYGMLLFCYQCTPREALYSLSVSLAVQNAVYNLFWITMLAAGFPEYSLTALCVSWGLMLLIYGTALLIFWKWMRDREGHTLPRHRVIQNAVVILLFVTFFNARTKASPAAFSVYLAYLMADMLAFSMQLGLLHETDLSHKNELIRQLLAAEQKKQKMTAENIEIINRKCHDLKHQIEGLRRMSSDKERNAYIEQVENAVLFYESAVKTGNETLDLILMEKQLYCKEHGITLTGVCDGGSLNALDTMDLYALFGNALENAIESVSSEAPENRIISFRAGQRGGFLSIHFENYLGHPLTMRDGLPITGKNDQNYHGFGMLSIRHIVEKYKGTMTIQTDQNLFRLDILLPRGQKI